MAGAAFGKASVAPDGLLTADWRMGDGMSLTLIANLSDREISHATAAPREP